MSEKVTQKYHKKEKYTCIAYIFSLWQMFIILTFYMHKDDLLCVDSYILPRMQQ